MDNQRVLMIFTRVGDFAKRNAVRQTYFQVINNRSNNLNYIYFFGLARPPPDIRASVDEEHQKFKDLVILNNEEGYYITTYKLLTGMKFATCCCPNAKYFIKADVDTYLRIRKFDSDLNQLQKTADFENPLLRIPNFYGKTWENHVPIYSGGICVIKFIPRHNHHALTEEMIPGKNFPFKFCFGALEIFSMPLTKLIVEYCPRHCFGDYNHSVPLNTSRPCSSKGEDPFIGSCIYSHFRNEVFVENIHRLGFTYMPSKNITTLANSKNLDKHVLASQVNGKDQMEMVHQFFEKFDGEKRGSGI